MSGTNLEGERDGVDGDDLAARVVLQRACEEGLREEEAGDPVDGRHALLDPVVDERLRLSRLLHEVEVGCLRAVVLACSSEELVEEFVAFFGEQSVGDVELEGLRAVRD